MKAKHLLALLFLLCSCNNNTSSLSGGQLIEESEYIPSIISQSSSASSETSSIETLNKYFIGEFHGEDSILTTPTTLLIDEQGKATIDNELEDHFEFNFVQQEKSSLGSYTAYFEDELDNKMVLEQGSSYLFVTINEGALLENSNCSYSSSTFTKVNK